MRAKYIYFRKRIIWRSFLEAEICKLASVMKDHPVYTFPKKLCSLPLVIRK